MFKPVIMLRTFLSCCILLVSTALSAQRSIQYLSGTDAQNTVAWDFFCTGGRNSGKWSTIQVPSHWEQQGFGAYNYGRDYKTYGRNFRFADEQGMYRHRFSVPSSWKGKKVSIVFEGSMTDTDVRINGLSAGPRHQGAFYRFSYDISNKIQYGRSNLLEVTVSKMSADASVNNAERLADYWIFGGIFRPVYLEAVPKEHISHVAIDAKADGTFAMNVFVRERRLARTVAGRILDANGKQVAAFSSAIQNGEGPHQVKTFVKGPLTWTAETPHLYTVEYSLKNGAAVLHTGKQRFGFRTIEIRKGDGIYLNGVKIKMKGVNRHVWWPETGRAVTPAIDLADVKLIKEMNMNAVRCSHYPPDQRFLDYCDSLGLYVLDELAGWQKAYSTKAGAPLVEEMVTRDANHPSILFWSNGNEGGHNKELDDDYALYDLSARPVIHAHHRPGNAFNGIDCNHYEDYYSSQSILRDSNIYMPTEFLHSQDDGGAGAALNEFWELHWREKKGAGGFLWDLADEGIVRTDLNNIIDVNGVNAPDGVVGPHREREGSFYAIKEIYSPVKIAMKELAPGFNGSIEVENRFHFTNLNSCSFHWALVNFRRPGDPFAGFDILQSGKALSPDISPNGGKGMLNLALPDGWQQSDALFLSAFDNNKNLLYKWTWKVKSGAQFLSALLPPADTASATLSETDSTFVLSGGDVTVTISRKDGLLRTARNRTGDPLSFSKGPILVSGTSSLSGMRSFAEGAVKVVEASYTGDLGRVRWKMHGNGWLSLEYEYTLNGTYPFAGVSFSYPENFVLGAKWLGKGPYRVWKNRLQGVTYNVWQNAYNNTQTGSAPWIYPEFKGYYADVSWMEFNTVEGKFTVVSPDTGLYVRLFDFYGLSGARPQPELPPGNISFLDHIPPVGTKLALNISYNTAQLGPQSELNRINGTQKRTLYFYFGLPKPSTDKPQFTMPAVNELF